MAPESSLDSDEGCAKHTPKGMADRARLIPRRSKRRDTIDPKEASPHSSADPQAKRPVPANLALHCSRPGQSGNPGGFNGEHGEALRLARKASPGAVRRLIELMRSSDERVAVVACNSLLDRALGKPKEAIEPPATQTPTATKHSEEIKQFVFDALEAKAEGKW